MPVGTLDTEDGDGFYQRLARLLGMTVHDLKSFVLETATDHRRKAMGRVHELLPKGNARWREITRRSDRTRRKKGITTSPPEAVIQRAASRKITWDKMLADPKRRATFIENVTKAVRSRRVKVRRALGLAWHHHPHLTGGDVERVLCNLAERERIRTEAECAKVAEWAHTYLAERHQRHINKQETRPANREKWVRLMGQRIWETVSGSKRAKIDHPFRRTHERRIFGLFPDKAGRPRTAR